MQTDKEHLGKLLTSRFERVSSSTERNNIASYWQQTADLVRPLKGFTTDVQPGARRDHRIFDNTAMKNSTLLAGALHGTMANPAVKWHGFRDRRPELSTNERVTRWFAELADRSRYILTSPRFGFSTQSQEGFHDLVDFGTMAMSFEERKDGPKFVTHPLAMTYYEPDGDCNIRGVFRKWTMPLLDALERFGRDAMHPEILRAIQANEQEIYTRTITMVHAVYERSDFDPMRMDGASKRYASVYMDLERKHVMKVGGFDRWPWMTPRFWKNSGWVYGVGPSMMLLADIGMLNAIRATHIEAAELAAHPPLVVQANSIEAGKLNVGPRSIIYSRMGSSNPITPLDTGAQLENIERLLETERAGLRAGFFLDLLTLPELDRMTAVEVMQRVQQRMTFLSPIAHRINEEFLSPVVENVFIWLREHGELPGNVPEELKRGGQVVVDFTSTMEMSQRAGEANAYLQWMASIAPLTQDNPEAQDWVNSDHIIPYLGSLSYRLPADFIRKQADVDARRQSRNQMAQQMQQAEVARTGAEAAESGANALKLVREANAA